MEMKRMFVQIINLETGKIFSLPTLYADRTEACVRGQNYVRDREAEDPCSNLFFRVLVSENGQVDPEYYLWEDEDKNKDNEACPHPEQESCEDCPFYSECWDFDDEDCDEEPEHGESVYGDTE